LTPEIAVGGRRRTELVDGEHAHPRVVDRRARLELGHACVHAARRAARRYGHGQVGTRADSLTEDVGGDFGQLVGIAGDQDMHVSL